jgi:hypothetical protein
MLLLLNVHRKKCLLKIFLMVLIFNVAACKKDPFDYRTPYLGNYKFKIHLYSTLPEYDTIYYFDGNVRYGYDDESIRINWNSDTGFYDNLFLFFEDGSFLRNSYNGNFYSRGDFMSSKHVEFYVRSVYKYCVITGDKIK